jgi:6-hydroxytryprostatin B O-methyltransferase
MLSGQSEPTLLDRLTFQPHDFFTAQPTTHASVYLLKWILHNWSDDDARRILTPLAQAMGPDSKILVVDIVMPEHGVLDLFAENVLRQMDLGMWAMLNGVERDLAQWRELFEAVEGGLEIERVIPPGITRTRDSVLVVRKRF